MKVFKFIITLILQVVFFLTIINTIHAKNIDKYQDADKISKYFSGILSFIHSFIVLGQLTRSSLNIIFLTLVNLSSLSSSVEYI